MWRGCGEEGVEKVWRGGCVRVEGLKEKSVHSLERVRHDEGAEEGEESDPIPRRVGTCGDEGEEVRGEPTLVHDEVHEGLRYPRVPPRE